MEFNPYVIELKTLNRLENLIKKAANFVFERNGMRAVRTKDGTLDTRTHNIDLNLEEMTVSYEGGASKWYYHKFETPEAAQKWWNTHIINAK